MSKELEFVLGHDEAGEKVICDLEKMPHLLIAGVAGTGKTTLLLKMMQAFSQHGIDMIAADATLGADMAELDLPKLMIPLALGKKGTVALIKFAKRELDRRCGLLSSSGARDIKRYNETAEEKLSRLVIFIDDIKEIMLCPDEVEADLVNIAMMGRNAGMHLVITSQSAYPDVITGLIRANIPSRIAFLLPYKEDSLRVLDHEGAQELKNPGEMLYMPLNAESPIFVIGEK
ncbi:MAG: DUF853 family protein [Clostridia bacterium]|nr:DUF853 family protein [Clostridia bacterium]